MPQLQGGFPTFLVQVYNVAILRQFDLGAEELKDGWAQPLGSSPHACNLQGLTHLIAQKCSKFQQESCSKADP